MKSFLILLALVIAAMAASDAAAQSPSTRPTPTPTPVEDDDVIRVESKLVVVPVSVLDSAGNPVGGLTAKDFMLSEEGRQQEIADLAGGDRVPLEIAVLIDISASTGGMFEYQQETAARFLLEVMKEDDRASVFTIGNETLLYAARQTADVAGAVIRKLSPTKEQTAFYDSVSVAARFIERNAPDGARKVILTISDGDDTNSAGVLRAIFEAEGRLVKGGMSTKEIRELRVRARDAAKLKEQHDVLKALQNADAVFYAVNTAGGSASLSASLAFGQSNLDRFASETGGSSHSPRFEPVSLKDPVQNEYNLRRNQEMLSKIFKVISNELRAQYLLQYYSDAEFARGRFVELKVGLKGRPGLRVRSRGGYFVK
jgi:Ca-activated chloride channel family protein